MSSLPRWPAGFQVRIDLVGLIRDLLDVHEDRKARILNNLDKGHVDDLAQELEAAGMGNLQDDLLALVDLRGRAEVLEQATELVDEQEGLRCLDDLGALLARCAIEDVVLDLGVVRGLDYYTGAVFELHYEPLGAASQICSGGSCTLTDILGGAPLQTTGLGIGCDRVILALDRAGVELPAARLDVYVLPIGDHMAEAAYEVLRQLGQAGLSADVDLVGRGPAKNLNHANAIGAQTAVFVGEREWEAGKVGVEDLETGEQVEVPLDELSTYLGAT